MTTISITRVEQAINRCKHAQPPVDYVLGPDLRVLATIWAVMIWDHLPVVELEAQSDADRVVLSRWLIPTDDGAPAAASVQPTPGGESTGECDACQ